MRASFVRQLGAAAMLLGIAAAVGCGRNQDLTELRDQQRQILAKLNALEEKLDRSAARPAPPPRAAGPDPARAFNLPVGNSPVKGPADAPVTIVEFSDYQCPFCARTEPLVRQALAAYPTQAKLVYKHMPLVSIHPQALPAALAATAAGRQGKFWEMHEKLFGNQKDLGPDQFRQYARDLGLDMNKFEADMQSEQVKAAVQEDMQLAQRVGIRGTPTIFVNGRILQNRSLEGFKQIIDPALKEADSGQKPPDQTGGS